MESKRKTNCAIRCCGVQLKETCIRNALGCCDTKLPEDFMWKLRLNNFCFWRIGNKETRKEGGIWTIVRQMVIITLKWMSTKWTKGLQNDKCRSSIARDDYYFFLWKRFHRGRMWTFGRWALKPPPPPGFGVVPHKNQDLVYWFICSIQSAIFMLVFLIIRTGRDWRQKQQFCGTEPTISVPQKND